MYRQWGYMAAGKPCHDMAARGSIIVGYRRLS